MVKLWRRRKDNVDASQARRESEEKLKAAKKATPIVERTAEKLVDLPKDDFARRIAEAFGPRT